MSYEEEDTRPLTFETFGSMHAAGVPCPKPLLLRTHVLIMQVRENMFFLSLTADKRPREHGTREHVLFVLNRCCSAPMYSSCRYPHYHLLHYAL